MFYDSYEWYHLKLNFSDFNKWCVFDIDAKMLTFVHVYWVLTICLKESVGKRAE